MTQSEADYGIVALDYGRGLFLDDDLVTTTENSIYYPVLFSKEDI